MKRPRKLINTSQKYLRKTESNKNYLYQDEKEYHNRSYKHQKGNKDTL